MACCWVLVDTPVLEATFRAALPDGFSGCGSFSGSALSDSGSLRVTLPEVFFGLPGAVLPCSWCRARAASRSARPYTSAPTLAIREALR